MICNRFIAASSFMVLMLFASTVVPQSKPAGNGRVLKKILDEAVLAVGPKTAVKRIMSIDARADCVGPKGAYTTRSASVGSNKVFFQRTFTYRDKPTNVKVVDDIGWNVDSDPFSPEIMSAFQNMVLRLHEFQRMAFDFQNMFTDFELTGEEIFNSRESFKVKAKSEIGWPVNLYFDKATKVLSGYVIFSPDGETVTNRFDERRSIEGLNLPVKVTAVDSQGDWVFSYKSVKFNTISESIFEIPTPVKDMSALLRLHKQAETAHLTYDADLFISMFGENLTQIQAGKVVTRDKKSNLARFRQYFSSFRFEAWENIVPPVVKISKDGTLATVQVQKRVTGKYTDEGGKVHSSETVFAWLEVWEKIGDSWKVVTVASTRKE